MNETNNIKLELSKLDRDISQAKWGAIAVMVLVIATYCLWFVFKVEAPISLKSTDWGTFGDYFGGLLNPVIGLFALYWLTKSVRLQREELFETRATLVDSAKSQQNQVKLAALTALTNSIMAETEILHTQSIFLLDQLKNKQPPFPGIFWNIKGDDLTYSEVRAQIISINEKISNRLNERIQYENDIKTILKEDEKPCRQE